MMAKRKMLEAKPNEKRLLSVCMTTCYINYKWPTRATTKYKLTNKDNNYPAKAQQIGVEENGFSLLTLITFFIVNANE